MRRRSITSRTTLALACSLAAACADSRSSERLDARCAEHESTIDLSTPEVSFRREVMPIVTRSCTFSSCHGRVAAGGLLLPPNDTSASRAALVDVPSEQLRSMSLVEPGEPARSYLMHKLDGDQCLFDAECVNETCGAPMPQGGERLDLADRDTIRRWIAQGARDD
jgi:hypothetical protein